MALKLREDLDVLIEDYLTDLKNPIPSRHITKFQRFFLALKAIQELDHSNPNSFFYLASYHGASSPDIYTQQRRLAGVSPTSQQFCAHGIPEFPAWHRVYLSKYEKALQSIDPEVTLPYWNELSEVSKKNGFNPLLAAAEVELADGSKIPNPLLGYELQAGISTRFPQGTKTFRNSGKLSKYVATEHASVLKRAMENGDYDTFSNHQFANSLESPHDNIHGYTGGFMGSTTTAAFDPIFWLHHCFIDYMFWAWQQKYNQDKSLQTKYLKNQLIPFEKSPKVFYTIQDTVSPEAFNYHYPDFNLQTLGIESKNARRLFSSLRSAPVLHKDDSSTKELTISGIDFAKLGGTIIIKVYAFPPTGKVCLGSYTVFRSSEECENCVVRSTVPATFRMKAVHSEHDDELDFKFKFTVADGGSFSFRTTLQSGFRHSRTVLGNTFEISF